MKLLLRRMLDESEFLFDYGVRAISRYHQNHPYTFQWNGHGNILWSVLDFRDCLAAIPVLFTMIVAYLTADQEALTSLLSNSDKFVKADPFPFLLLALIVFVFGLGYLSLDALFGRKLWHRAGAKPDR